MLHHSHSHPYLNKTASGVISPCSILNKSIQRLAAISATSWTDSVSGNDVSLVNSNCLSLNGTDNLINTSIYIQPKTPIVFDLQGKTHAAFLNDYRVPFYGGAYTSVLNGLYIRSSAGSGSIRVVYYDGSTSHQWFSSLAFSNSQEFAFHFDWNGLIGGTMTMTLNGVTETHIALSEMSAQSQSVQLFAYRASAWLFDADIYEASLSLNNTTCYVPFSIGEGNKVYCVNLDVEYTVLGTTPVWAQTNNKKHYNITKGFNIVGTAKIPASQLNAGFDVLGNTLSNPLVLTGHNGAETELRQQEIATLIAAETNLVWFDGGGAPKDVAFSEIPQNSGNYSYCNVISAANQKQQIAIFAQPLTSDEDAKLDQCYLRSIIA